MKESFARRHGSPAEPAQAAGVWPLLPEPLRVSWALLWDDLESAPPGDPDQQLADMAPGADVESESFVVSSSGMKINR